SPTSSTAAMPASTRSEPKGSPAARSTRAKCAMFSAIRPAIAGASGRMTLEDPLGAQLLEDCRAGPGVDARDVVLVLEQLAERVGDRLRVERQRVERDERVGPVDGLGHPGRLEEIERAGALHEADHLLRESFPGTGGLAPDDVELARRVRIVDPGVPAAPLQG